MNSGKLFFLLCALLATPLAHAGESKVIWYDVSCRYMLAEMPDGFGLFEWRTGPEPKAEDFIVGDISGGPEVEATLKSTNEKVTLIHWGDAPKMETLLRAAPRGCLNKPKKK